MVDIRASASIPSDGVDESGYILSADEIKVSMMTYK
jgi:hypothetical protein